MNLVINAIEFKGIGNIKKIPIIVPPNTRTINLIKGALIRERNKIIDCLKNLKKEGKIKSIFIPKNRLMKKELKEMVEAKREINNSLRKIIDYYK